MPADTDVFLLCDCAPGGRRTEKGPCRKRASSSERSIRTSHSTISNPRYPSRRLPAKSYAVRCTDPRGWWGNTDWISASCKWRAAQAGVRRRRGRAADRRRRRWASGVSDLLCRWSCSIYVVSAGQMGGVVVVGCRIAAPCPTDGGVGKHVLGPCLQRMIGKRWGGFFSPAGNRWNTDRGIVSRWWSGH